MARIVGVHGVGQLGNPPPEIVEQWWKAIVRGQAGHLPQAGITEQDFSVAYYAPLYRRGGTKGLASELDVRDLDSGWEQEFLLALAGEAEPNSELAQAMTKFVPIWSNLQRALNLLLVVPGMGQLTESTVLAWFVREVYRYLHEPAIRRGAQATVLSALSPEETRVVIAHSLGSVVTYEALSRDSKQVELLITCGSPLGLQKLVFDKLQPPPSHGRLPWPGNVRRWINFAQPKDVVAMTKKLSPLVSPGPLGQVVEDVLVPDPSGLFRAHNADHYLDQSEVAAALAAVFPGVS